MKLYEKFIEEKSHWNQVLHDATWTHEKIGEKEWRIDFDLLKDAIENGADVDSEASLEWAVIMKKPEIVKYLLEHGANVNYQNTDMKFTPISHLLLIQNDSVVHTEDEITIAQILIEFNADFLIGNVQDNKTIDILFSIDNYQFVNLTQFQVEFREIVAELLISHIIKNHQFEKYDNYLEYFNSIIKNSDDPIIKRLRKTKEFNL